MLYYKATAGCGVRVLGPGAQAHRPRFSHPGSCSGALPPPRPTVDRPLSFATRCTLMVMVMVRLWLYSRRPSPVPPIYFTAMFI